MAKSRAANAAKNPSPFLSKTFIQASTAADKILIIGSRGITPVFLSAPSIISIKAYTPQSALIICFACKAPGHVVADCPTRKGTMELKEITNKKEINSEAEKKNI
jgi:hypothetical protein